MSALEAAQTPQQLLAALKDLKNSVIGNTWKKVEVAEDARVMQLYVVCPGRALADSVSSCRRRQSLSIDFVPVRRGGS